MDTQEGTSRAREDVQQRKRKKSQQEASDERPPREAQAGAEEAPEHTIEDQFEMKFINMSPRQSPRNNQRKMQAQRAPVKLAVRTCQVSQEELLRLVQDEAMSLPDLSLVVSGMSGRFPKSDSMNEFEENLREGRDMINHNDESRFTCGLWGLPPRAGRLKDLSKFDFEFFGFTQEEANYVDFQLRILYEVVYESILDAGLNPANLRGSNTGVFFGLHCNEFENAMADDPAFKTNGYYAQFAVKVAQYFDFRGVTLTFDAACASGFVGLHSAVESLREGIIDRAIVCSSNIPVHPTGSFIFYQMQMLSPTGYSRFLDSRADGYVKSEACVSCLLERKQVAQRNYASFMNTMTSVDGYKKEGITFPSWESQETLIRAAKEMAGLSTNHIEYLEAHGTGTPAGDPQEARAISNVYFREDPEDDSGASGEGTGASGTGAGAGAPGGTGKRAEKRCIGPLLVGSVKTNMGHSEAASGLCALAKVALMFENELIYRNLHFDQPNTNIDALMDGRLKFVDSTLKLNSKIIPLSCYGFGGSNVHAICRANEREALPLASENSDIQLATGGLPRLVLMFGRTAPELEQFFTKLLEGRTYNTQNCLSDDFLALLDSLSSDKIDRLMDHRGFALVRPNERAEIVPHRVARCELAPLVEELASPLVEGDLGRRVHLQEARARSCHLLFAGLGCQWPGMGTGGLERLRPFRGTIERLRSHLSRWPGADNHLLPGLLGDNSTTRTSNEPTESLRETFVAIVAFQVAQVNLVRDVLQVNNLGASLGHSLGEISALYAANRLDERQAVLVAHELGRALDELKPIISGKMVALVGTPSEQVVELVHHQSEHFETLRVSCLNGPNSVTVSASHEDMARFMTCKQMESYKSSVLVQEVSSEFALHNELVMGAPGVRQRLRSALEPILKRADDSSSSRSEVRTQNDWVSSFVHQREDQAKLGENLVEYLVEMLCRPVDFAGALRRLPEDSIVYDLSPSNVLESQIVQVTVPPTSAKGRGDRAAPAPEGPQGKIQPASAHARGTRAKFHYVKCAQRPRPADTPQEGDAQLVRLLSSLGELYLAGATFKLANLYTAQTGQAPRWPVRRRTPSLSSLVGWNHSAELFVPRYPAQFSKSSAKCELPIDLVQDRDKYLAGHCIEGRILHPATGYLFLVWRIFSFTKRKIYDACFQDIERELMPVEFRNVRLMRAVILGSRQAQMYVHFEEATGRFEVKEGGSVVVEGYALTPTENPRGLLYDHVRERLSSRREDIAQLSKEDVYKQFRVSGYDYGDSFQCIESSSYDGQVCRVKFNGHFICLTDSILQSIFLAISQYAPSGSLFLPTRFDYVRFQPEIILAKLRAANMPFDQSDGSLNTKAKREMMNKIMQRESDAGKAGHQQQVSDEENEEEQEEENEEEQEKQRECIFETFCDPVTGIIITDGIEMRGIKASPAPRRMDTNEVLLESYQFVRDFEEPVRDERLTRYEEQVAAYRRCCDALSLELLETILAGGESRETLRRLAQSSGGLAPKEKVESYMREHLACVYDQAVCTTPASEPASESGADPAAQPTNGESVYDIKKNGPRTLLSVLEQLVSLARAARDREAAATGDETKPGHAPLTLTKLRERVHENRQHLLRDLLQASYMSERFVRPLVETVIENTCTKKTKLRMIEINLDDGILRQKLQQLIGQIEPQLSLDYSLAHPDPNRLHGSQVAAVPAGGGGAKQDKQQLAPPTNNKTHTLKPDNVAALFQDNQLRNLDLIVYKDSSCYSPACEGEFPSETLAAIAQGLRVGGYCLVLLRRELTLAERVLLTLSGSPSEASGSEPYEEPEELLEEIGRANERLGARFASLLASELVATSGFENSENSTGSSSRSSTERHGRSLLLVASKSDPGGCASLLFRRVAGTQQQVAGALTSLEVVPADEPGTSLTSLGAPKREPLLLLRVRHDADEPERLAWLDQLKANFAPAPSTGGGESSSQTTDDQQAPAAELANGTTPPASLTSTSETRREPRRAWLCAVATRENPISGLVGMMQALRRELGSSQLRCFYDMHTFADAHEPIGIEQIEASAAFQAALRRDHIWNCVDVEGQPGAFRHFTINDFLSYEECACALQKQPIFGPASSDSQTKNPPNGLGQICGPETTRGQESPTEGKLERDLRRPTGAFVNNSTRGDLSSFAWFEAPLKYLTSEEHNEQLVRVAYSALNFRDIMLATGRLPLDAVSPRLAMSDCLLGLEFSGYDTRGRRVMGMVYGRGIATHVLCPRDSSIMIEIPEWLSLREAATIPVVYATAVMALLYRGRAMRGESVLIHAGSGGVGQAAIRLALHYGLEVYTTVGSAEKRHFLQEEFGPAGLREDRILNSRTCEFEHQILRMTRGRGVDLVLNSLADDKLQASLNCLADGGRFLEIGKYDMSVDARLELLKLDTNKSFHGILLDKLFDTDEIGVAFRQQLKMVMSTLEEGIREGFIRPIRHRLFPSHQVEEAFRFMATGKHIGKVLIEIGGDGVGVPDEGPSRADGRAHADSQPAALMPGALAGELKVRCVPRFQLSPEKSFIVTGGLGGFGLELCKWLVAQGARSLVLTSRQGLRTGYQRATLRRLESTTCGGARVTIVTEREVDASTPEGARELVRRARELAPGKQVGGVFHLAMVLRDTLLENMSREDFELVCRPKVSACLALDAATRFGCASTGGGGGGGDSDATRQVKAQVQVQPLDYFVCFSSITSGKGNAGQANYAYANSCLERVCEQRRARGLHGLAIQWGAIGDVGVAFENLGGNDVIIGGTIPQRMPSCLATLGKLLCSPFATCLSVLPVSRSQDGSGERGDLVGAIMHVLGIKDASKVSDDATLGDLGLDSLMAVEIRQYIEREYDMTLNIQEIRALTIARIREISENEKPAAVGATSKGGSKQQPQPGQVEKRQVASYGRQAGAPGKAVPDELTMTTNSQTADTQDDQDERDEGETSYDKRLISTFVPALVLPREDFCKLNEARPGGDEDSRRPLFFLPPIHGNFEKLEPICAQIERPCVGLNWTRKLGKVASVGEAVEIYLQLLESTDWARAFSCVGGADSSTATMTSQNEKHRTTRTEPREQVVDLVGYSFGATIAFELMCAIERRQTLHKNQLERRLSNGSPRPPELLDAIALVGGGRRRKHSPAAANSSGSAPTRNVLKPGKLILLDGSPRQIELGSQYLARLTNKQLHLKVVDKIDELLMLFVMANVRAREQRLASSKRQSQQTVAAATATMSKTGGKFGDKFANKFGTNSTGDNEHQPNALAFLQLQRELKLCNDLEAKMELAAGKLVELLGRLPVRGERVVDRESVKHAMEAFLRRYELISNYKARAKSLQMDCALIRAEQLYLKSGGGGSPGAPEGPADEIPTQHSAQPGARTDQEGGKRQQQQQQFNEDLDLASLVRGRVQLHVLRGDHESFLSENTRQVSQLIGQLIAAGGPSAADRVGSPNADSSYSASLPSTGGSSPSPSESDRSIGQDDQDEDERPGSVLSGESRASEASAPTPEATLTAEGLAVVEPPAPKAPELGA